MSRLGRVRLDHARGSASRHRGPTLALAAALFVCAALATYAFQLGATAAQLQAQILARQDSEKQAAPRAPARADPAAVAADREAAQVRAELALPWDRLFRAIESAAGPDVSLLMLTPAPARAQLTLGGEARNMASLLTFLKRLQGSGTFSRAYLREHHIDPADAQQVVRFSMELKWSEVHG